MRAWVEISTENLKYNVNKFKELGKGKEILGVVKTDAYALGSVKIASILKETGINFFGVANLEEAIELQEAGINSKILVLGPSFDEDFIEAEKKEIHLGISSFEQLNFLKENNLKTPIHIKIDTGMTRLGFDIDNVEEAINFCFENKLNLKGVFSHLSDSSIVNKSNTEFTLSQIEKFKKIIKNYDIEYKHISNSSGLSNFSEDIYGNLVRLGIGMYGFNGNKKDYNLKNTFTLKTKIAFIKKVKNESFVSYSRLYKLKPEECYAVLPLGYADGLKKYLSKGSYVLINNIKCEIIGSICMDMCMVKIPKEIENSIKIGDEVIVLNSDILDSLDIPELCIWDIMTGLGKRVKRIFI